MNQRPSKGGALLSAAVYYESGVAAAEAAMASRVKAPRETQLIVRNPGTWHSGETAAGVAVTDGRAMTFSAFFSCARLLCSTVAGLPLGLYQPGANGAAQPVRDLALARVLRDSPNADQTALDYWEFKILAMIMRGNGFALKDKRRNGEIVGLEPVRPDIVTIYRRDDGRRGYRWTWDGERYDLTEDDVFHVPAFGGGPLGGISILTQARESLGVALAADRAAAGMFKNGVRPSGTLNFKEYFPDADKRNEYRDLVESRFAGAVNAGRPFILEGGAEWKQISMNADDAQLLESRGWSVEEICRWFGVPPFMIGHSEKSTSWGTGIEQQLLGFYKFTLLPWLRRIEQAISKQLLTAEQRAAGIYPKFNVEGLLRADSMARANFYQTMTRNGVMTVNECRAKEDLPPIEGGDVARVQAQNVPLEDSLREALTGGSSTGA